MMQLRLDRFESPLGTLMLVTDDAGLLRALDYADYEPRMRKLLRLHYGDFTLIDLPAPEPTCSALADYFAGRLDALDTIRTGTGGTEFQREIWQALRSLPAGQTISYGRLAANIGRPRASRAVGAANGANPIAIVVPCHRVVGSAGTLTGYAGGLTNKRWLLDHERRWSILGVACPSARIANV